MGGKTPAEASATRSGVEKRPFQRGLSQRRREKDVCGVTRVPVHIAQGVVWTAE